MLYHSRSSSRIGFLPPNSNTGSDQTTDIWRPSKLTIQHTQQLCSSRCLNNLVLLRRFSNPVQQEARRLVEEACLKLGASKQATWKAPFMLGGGYMRRKIPLRITSIRRRARGTATPCQSDDGLGFAGDPPTRNIATTVSRIAPVATTTDSEAQASLLHCGAASRVTWRSAAWDASKRGTCGALWTRANSSCSLRVSPALPPGFLPMCTASWTTGWL